MAAAKIVTLRLRITPGLKKARRTATERARRHMADVVGVKIRERCGLLGVPIQHKQTPRSGN